jgi:hypothetical protein
MKKKVYIFIPLIMLVLLALACDLPIPGFGDSDGDCEPGTTRIEMNRSINAQITQDDDDLAFCTEYCLWVPEGGSRLDITISDFDVDLDLYVDTSYQVLMGTQAGEARWESIEFGTDDESVSISGPGGRYYIQVCSYEGHASAFTLDNSYTP